MLGRTGKIGDKVVTYNDLAESGLLIAKPQALTNPSSSNQSINDSLTKPDTGTGTSGTVSPGTPLVEPPTTPVGLKTAGIFGAIVLEWTPPRYSGHSYTEIYRAQVDDVTQSAMTHVALGPVGIFSRTTNRRSGHLTTSSAPGKQIDRGDPSPGP